MGELFTLLATTLLFPQDASLFGGEKFFPEFSVSASAEYFYDFQPLITAPSVFMVDVSSGTTLWNHNGDERRAMASLTKLMTALIILEKHDMSEIASVPPEAVQMGGASMGLVRGERMTVGNLMKGLMIPSGNDAAVTLAVFHSGSVERFVEEMNRRAYFLGMKDTQFKNPHGLDEEGHFSTAYDLGLLARKVLEFPEIRQFANTTGETVSSSDDVFRHELRTTNDLLLSPFPIYGLKTGTTDEAGQCLITFVRSGRKEVLIVVLGSEDRFYDTKSLLYPFL